MLKKSLVYGLLVVGLVLSGCSNKENTNVVQKAQFKDIKIGNKLANFTLEDQFDKKHSLTNKTKKVLFAFSKPTGHIMKVYMGVREVDYLTSRDILFVADVSGMPKIIFNMFALADMKESKYPMLLILKKENAKRFRDENKKDSIMILSLKNKVITNIEFANSEDELKKAID